MIDMEKIKAFDTISLEEMEKVKLMNRIDTKFVTSIDKIEDLLRLAADKYLIQEINGQSNMPYYTRYFDTTDTDMYYQHVRGRKNRQKIRIREYENSGTPPFIEIKTKNNKGRTNKKRVKMSEGKILEPYHEFLQRHSNYDPAILIPQIENHFYRITLVDKEMTERITIDTGLEFRNLITGSKADLSKIGIIEWKRDGKSNRSGLATLLRQLRIHQSGFSKYCIGMAVTNPELRQNRLKPKIRMINRIKPEYGNS